MGVKQWGGGIKGVVGVKGWGGQGVVGSRGGVVGVKGWWGQWWGDGRWWWSRR